MVRRLRKARIRGQSGNQRRGDEISFDEIERISY
jgi:hypothetical protein